MREDYDISIHNCRDCILHCHRNVPFQQLLWFTNSEMASHNIVTTHFSMIIGRHLHCMWNDTQEDNSIRGVVDLDSLYKGALYLIYHWRLDLLHNWTVFESLCNHFWADLQVFHIPQSSPSDFYLAHHRFAHHTSFPSEALPHKRKFFHSLNSGHSLNPSHSRTWTHSLTFDPGLEDENLTQHYYTLSLIAWSILWCWSVWEQGPAPVPIQQPTNKDSHEC